MTLTDSTKKEFMNYDLDGQMWRKFINCDLDEEIQRKSK